MSKTNKVFFEESGIFLIYKPKGISSFGVDKIIKHKFSLRKIGHCGTLDYLAEGLQILCVNQATKIQDYFLNAPKTYEAHLVFGYETSTLDLEGEVTNFKNVDFIDENILNSVLNSFIKKQMQEIPVYSAKKFQGKKLYEYAHKKQNVEKMFKEIEIYSLKNIFFKNNYLIIEVKCSKGTFIRTLIRDIASCLKEYATLVKLIRLEYGNYHVKDAKKIENISVNDLINLALINKEHESLLLK